MSTHATPTSGRHIKKPELLRRYPWLRPRTLAKYMRDGLIPYLKLGSSKQAGVLFDVEAVEKALARCNRGVRAK